MGINISIKELGLLFDFDMKMREPYYILLW
ncbi:UNVERIFIED_ORG: hypothetical protein EDC93_1011389 [Bacillus cereus]